MIKQISIFDDERNIRISYLPELDKKFEITDGNMQHIYLSESQLESLPEMIQELLQSLNKRDW